MMEICSKISIEENPKKLIARTDELLKLVREEVEITKYLREHRLCLTKIPYGHLTHDALPHLATDAKIV
jgi:hypothetical protein